MGVATVRNHSVTQVGEATTSVAGACRALWHFRHESLWAVNVA